MLSRAERTTPIVTSGCTNEDVSVEHPCRSISTCISFAPAAHSLLLHSAQVGPGSYAVLETLQQQKHQGPSAAFAWAGKRSTVPSSAQAAAEDLASTALDQAAGSARPWANKNATSSFSSATQRFLLNKEAAAKPGYICQQAAASVSCKSHHETHVMLNFAASTMRSSTS
jgi:hypothetical protein